MTLLGRERSSSEPEIFLQLGPPQPAGGRVHLGGYVGVDGLTSGLAAAQPLTPRVTQARPCILSLSVLKHRVGHPSPDTSMVSERVIIFNSLSQSFLPRYVLFRSHKSMPQAPSISEHTDGFLRFSTCPYTNCPGPQEEAELEHIKNRSNQALGPF